MEKEEWKFDTLTDLYDILTITQAVIFCQSIAHRSRDAMRSQRGDMRTTRPRGRGALPLEADAHCARPRLRLAAACQ